MKMFHVEHFADAGFKAPSRRSENVPRGTFLSAVPLRSAPEALFVPAAQKIPTYAALADHFLPGWFATRRRNHES